MFKFWFSKTEEASNRRHAKIPLDLLADPRLTGTDIRVAAIILAHAKTNQANPTQLTIAEYLGGESKLRTVKDSISRLKATGWVSAKQSGFDMPNTYTFSLPSEIDEVKNKATDKMLDFDEYDKKIAERALSKPSFDPRRAKNTVLGDAVNKYEKSAESAAPGDFDWQQELEYDE